MDPEQYDEPVGGEDDHLEAQYEERNGGGADPYDDLDHDLDYPYEDDEDDE